MGATKEIKMKIRYSCICSIPDQDLLDNGIDLTNKDEIEDFFWGMGGPAEFEDYGEKFEVVICD